MKRGNILVIILITVVAILSFATVGYLFVQNRQLQNQTVKPVLPVQNSAPTNNFPTPTPVSTPAPAIDPTANWKTYENKWYSLRYPFGWTLKDLTKDINTYNKVAESFVSFSPSNLPITLDKLGPITVQISTNTYEQALSASHLEGGVNVDRVEKDIVIAGSPAKMITGRVVSGGAMSGPIDKKVINILINRSDKPYRIESTPEYRIIFNQILSTFKFL